MDGRTSADHDGARRVYALLGVLIATDAAWSAVIGLSIGHLDVPVTIGGALLALSLVYRRRSRGAAQTAEGWALWTVLSAAGAVMTYLCATMALPLQDDRLGQIDGMVGFGWPANHAWLATLPLLRTILTLAYASMLPQIIFVVVALPALGRGQRNYECIALAAVTVVVCGLVSALYPALGPLALAMPHDAVHLHDLLRLRSAGPWHFELTAMQGIITMPSYHAVLAVLFTYAFRGTGVIGWCIAGLNALMLVSTVPIGGHYLADVAVGIAIALTAIVATRPRWPMSPFPSQLPLRTLR